MDTSHLAGGSRGLSEVIAPQTEEKGWREGSEVKMLDYSPPCYRLQGRLSQTEIFHFGSSLHLKSTNTKTIVFFPLIDCEEHSEGLGRDRGLRRQKISKDQHNNNNSNNKKCLDRFQRLLLRKCITATLGKKNRCHGRKKQCSVFLFHSFT